MKIVIANGKKKVVMTRKEWEAIGKKAQWTDVGEGEQPKAGASPAKPYRSSSRNVMRRAFLKVAGEKFPCRDSEDFDGSKGGLWTSNEDYLPSGRFFFNRYQEVAPEIEALLDKHGWTWEPYDSGTVLMYPMYS